MTDTFLNADCMDYLPLYPDDYFDLAIVDPPYGISIGHKQSDKRVTVRGSASSLIACEQLGYHYHGYEIGEEIYRIALDRMVEYRQQGVLMSLEGV